MQARAVRLFIFTSGLILVITATAKLVSTSGSARVLGFADPIFGISFKHMFWFVGVIELTVAAVCLLGRDKRLQAGLLAWLATSIVVYRLGLVAINYQRPCSCMGNLLDVVHISPQTSNTIMVYILSYLTIGSYVSIFWIMRNKRSAVLLAATVETDFCSRS